MARTKGQAGGGWAANQVVAHNLSRARELRGLTQAEVAERLTRHSGSPWSAITVAQAEGSVGGKRQRQFTAVELVALARTFDLPLLWFFLPPEDGQGAFATPDGGTRPWEYLLILAWGHSGNFEALADRAAPWAHASTVLVPDDDVLEADDDYFRRLFGTSREHLTPDAILAAAFWGMARRRLRGSALLGRRQQRPSETLRALAFLLEAFENYPPAAFFDTAILRRLAGWPEGDEEEDDGEDEEE